MDKEKVEKILQEFTEYLESEITSIKENGIERKPTLEDKVDFIKSCWESASDELFKLGIRTNY